MLGTLAVRRAVVTGVNATALKLRKPWWTNGLRSGGTSARRTRPSHAVWQGKIFGRSGTHPKYPSLVEGTGYGTGEGWEDGIVGIALCILRGQNAHTPNPSSTKWTLKIWAQRQRRVRGNSKQRYIERRSVKWEYKAMELRDCLLMKPLRSSISGPKMDDFLNKPVKTTAWTREIVGFGRSSGKAVAINRATILSKILGITCETVLLK